MKDFILFGPGSDNTLGVLHQLHNIGIDPLLLITGSSKDIKGYNIIGYSRYAKRIVEVADEKEGFDWIMRNKSQFESNTIIFPTSDPTERILDENFNILSRHFQFPNAGKEGAVSRLMDKQLQTGIAADYGLRIIKSQYSNSPDFDLNAVDYPCMVKPLNSTEGSKSDMRVCNSEAELIEALENGKHTRNFIVQQLLDSKADLLVLGNAFTNGDVWISSIVYKPGVSSIGEYSYCFVSTDVDKYLPEKKELIDFVKSLHYVGPFSVEFGVVGTKNYFFEINLRNDGTSHYPLDMGVNIAEAYINDRPCEDVKKMEYEMICEECDMKRLFSGQLTPLAWYKSYFGAGVYKYYYPGDYKLIPPLMIIVAKRIIDKLLRLLNI